jgi:transcriptional regulator with XRE-family HTH domain
MIDARQVRIARITRGLSQRELAKLSDVAIGTVNTIENGGEFRSQSMRVIQAALEAQGMIFANGEVAERMVWVNGRPASREVREAALGILNAGRKARGHAPYLDTEE